VCQFVFCDGSVRPVPVTLNGETNLETLTRLAVANDGEVVNLNF
jgi:hypothetical protein